MRAQVPYIRFQVPYNWYTFQNLPELELELSCLVLFLEVLMGGSLSSSSECTEGVLGLGVVFVALGCCLPVLICCNVVPSDSATSDSVG